MGSALLTYFLSRNQKTEAFFFSKKKEDITKRISTLEYNANLPIKDRISYGNFKNLKGYVAAVFDGHGGFQVAEYVSKNLIPVLQDMIVQEIAQETTIKQPSASNEDLDPLMKNCFLRPLDESKYLPEDRPVIRAIYKAFDKLETDYTQFASKGYKIGFPTLARMGSCALVSVYYKDKLFVANLGDSQGLFFKKMPAQNKTPNKKRAGFEDEFKVYDFTHSHQCKK